MQHSNPELQILGFVLTRYDARTKFNRYLRETITEQGEQAGAPFLAAIRSSIAIREAQGLQLSVFDYAPRCNAAQDYKALYNTITRKKHKNTRKQGG